MDNRIINWHIPYPGYPLPAFYAERTYTPKAIRIYAEQTGSKDFEVDIRDDGVTILNNRASTLWKTKTVYSEIAYNSLATSTFQVGEKITGGTSGAYAYVVSDGFGNMKLENISDASFTNGETITGGTSTATAVILNFSRGSLQRPPTTGADITTVVLPAGANLEESATDFPNNASDIEEGSIVTCHVIEMGGVGNVTIQLELETMDELDEVDSD